MSLRGGGKCIRGQNSGVARGVGKGEGHRDKGRGQWRRQGVGTGARDPPYRAKRGKNGKLPVILKNFQKNDLFSTRWSPLLTPLATPLGGAPSQKKVIFT